MSNDYAGDPDTYPATIPILEDGDLWNTASVYAMIGGLTDRTATLEDKTIPLAFNAGLGVNALSQDVPVALTPGTNPRFGHRGATVPNSNQTYDGTEADYYLVGTDATANRTITLADPATPIFGHMIMFRRKFASPSAFTYTIGQTVGDKAVFPISENAWVVFVYSGVGAWVPLLWSDNVTFV